MNRQSRAGRRALRTALCFAAGLALAACKAQPADAAFPNALWFVVHDVCGANLKLTGHAAPCLSLGHGYALLKDPRSAQLLVIPTRRMSGIESPGLLAPDAPNYWQAAWETKPLFEKLVRRPVPRADFGLAINSVTGRTQNQLHIHIDCVRPEIVKALAANLDRIGPQWADLNVRLKGRLFRAMLLKGADLGDRDPFKLLAASDPVAAADMGPETMAVIGVDLPTGEPGLVVLARRADMAMDDKGAAEGVLDHTCRVLHETHP